MEATARKIVIDNAFLDAARELLEGEAPLALREAIRRAVGLSTGEPLEILSHEQALERDCVLRNASIALMVIVSTTGRRPQSAPELPPLFQSAS